jgi:crossover junction endodeoxyribonuclease RusA
MFPNPDRSSFVDRPFGARRHRVHLPRPPSVNRIWRSNKAGNGRVSISPEYKNWKAQADILAISMRALRGVKKIQGAFEAHIILKRGRGDLDNRIKGVLDWAQSRELVRNDSDCEKLTIEYGDAPHGCRLILRGAAA